MRRRKRGEQGEQQERSSPRCIPPPRSPQSGLWPPDGSLAQGKEGPFCGGPDPLGVPGAGWTSCLQTVTQPWFQYICEPVVPMHSLVSHTQLPLSCVCQCPSPSPALPSPPQPTARLSRGAGLASVSITQASWVTSAGLDRLDRLDRPPLQSSLLRP